MPCAHSKRSRKGRGERERQNRKHRGKSKREKEEGWRRREGERSLRGDNLTTKQSSLPRAPSRGPDWLQSLLEEALAA